MKCPGCGNDLQEKKVSGITVNVCENGCGGIWFDNLEIKKFDEKHEAAGEELLSVKKDKNIKIDHSRTRLCPKCDWQKMMKHFFSVKRNIEIDECPNCGGIWLDYGELGQIRDEFKNEEERQNAARGYISELFDDRLGAMSAESDEQAERAKKITKALKFVCPGNYFPEGR